MAQLHPNVQMLPDELPLHVIFDANGTSTVNCLSRIGLDFGMDSHSVLIEWNHLLRIIFFGQCRMFYNFLFDRASKNDDLIFTVPVRLPV